ncbi:glycosyl transferase group 1 [Thermodesulfatator indicus DSM 15286]|uniref:Glycosyl transferase group 1 n=1 Tax=Thermodesulfatator indicus (strain DSM 15286 / JCM 11887 / CIR29812) TaxID=667014 RepID=F8AC33_THEID|nr:glycosyltransferase [Thermodesulfatator indicus]AEH44588.1 glycosyl transferase group 1 [Thermodesulfatator indicus DSM 15286]
MLTYPEPVICHVAHALNPGGTERLVCELARAFSKKAKVIVATLEEPGKWGLELRQEGIPVFPLFREPGIDLNLVWNLSRLIREHRIALIHAHQYTPFFYAGLARLFNPGVKLIFHEHGRHYPEVLKRPKNIFNRLVLQPLASEIVAVSEEVKERLVKYEGLSRKRIRVIYNGIIPPETIPAGEKEKIRARLGFSRKDFIVATVGRFDPIKNLPMLLKAIAMARTKASQIKGLLIGDGPEMEKLKALTKELGLSEHIIFTGFRQDAVKLVQVADVFALSSFSEGTSLALLEAMAVGLPAVVTAVGGNPEIVKDGQTGLLVPSDDEVKMAAALSLLAEEPNLKVKMAEAAQKHFFEHFTFAKMVKEFEKLYEETLAA